MVRISRTFIESIGVPIRKKDGAARGPAYCLKGESGRSILNRASLAFLRRHYLSIITYQAPLIIMRGSQPVRADEIGMFAEKQLIPWRTNPSRKSRANLGRIFNNAGVSLPEILYLSAEELKAMLALTDKDELISFLFRLTTRDFRPFFDNLSIEEADAIYGSLSGTTLEALFHNKKGSPSEVAVIYRKLVLTQKGRGKLSRLSVRSQLIIFDALSDERPQFLQAIGFDRQVVLFPRLGFRRHQAFYETMTSPEYTDQNALKDIFLRQDPYHQYNFYSSLSERGKTVIRSYGYKPVFSRLDRIWIKAKYTILSPLVKVCKFCHFIR